MTSFGDDVTFLRQHVDVIVLTDGAGAEVALVPEYQGRVMTSTSGGPEGPSFGWLNRDAIASGERREHINVFGGEDRFWLGPEGGQFGIFFAPGDPFDLEHWQTPEPIDWGPWETVDATGRSARFRRSMELENYTGTTYVLEAERTVQLLERARAAERLGADFGDAELVAFETVNTIENAGDAAWAKESGLLSIWILGMFNPSPETTVVIPFRPGPETELGPVVNDAYFGKVPEDRLVVDTENGVLFFRGDGEHRSKIGVPGPRALPIMGSYDPAGGALTLVQYTLADEAADYVNSMWEIQDEPYRGDAANSYNDGPPSPGAPPLGPFYELESSSPAAALGPGERLTHVHRTFHVRGAETELDALARRTLGVSVDEIVSAFRRQ